jgi:hypothetical protein
MRNWKTTTLGVLTALIAIGHRSQRISLHRQRCPTSASSPLRSPPLGAWSWPRTTMLAAKFIAAALVFAGYLLLPGCVTVGYDFLKQQATVTVTPSTKGLAK